MIVMVLSATKIFKYEFSENEQRRMFHATVATQTQFFHVKVLNINLKGKFIKKRIIIISNYSKHNSLLEVNEASSVSEAGPDQMFEVPKDIIIRAKKTPKINILHKQTSGYIVYGLYMLHTVRHQSCFVAFSTITCEVKTPDVLNGSLHIYLTLELRTLSKLLTSK